MLVSEALVNCTRTWCTGYWVRDQYYRTGTGRGVYWRKNTHGVYCKFAFYCWIFYCHESYSLYFRLPSSPVPDCTNWVWTHWIKRSFIGWKRHENIISFLMLQFTYCGCIYCFWIWSYGHNIDYDGHCPPRSSVQCQFKMFCSRMCSLIWIKVKVYCRKS